MPSLPSGFFPLLKMGWEHGMCKGPVANMPWESLRVSSLCRGVSHKMLYFFLLGAPDGTDLLTMFKSEGCLPFFQPLIITPLQPTHPPLPHCQLQGPNPKQDSDEPPENLALHPHIAQGQRTSLPGESQQHCTAPKHLPLTFPIGSLCLLSAP